MPSRAKSSKKLGNDVATLLTSSSTISPLAIWAAIAEGDDWTPLDAKIVALRRMGDALGEPPLAAGHS